jgi:hypothetical protein
VILGWRLCLPAGRRGDLQNGRAEIASYRLVGCFPVREGPEDGLAGGKGTGVKPQAPRLTCPTWTSRIKAFIIGGLNQQALWGPCMAQVLLYFIKYPASPPRDPRRPDRENHPEAADLPRSGSPAPEQGLKPGPGFLAPSSFPPPPAPGLPARGLLLGPASAAGQAGRGAEAPQRRTL